MRNTQQEIPGAQNGMAYVAILLLLTLLFTLGLIFIQQTATHSVVVMRTGDQQQAAYLAEAAANHAIWRLLNQNPKLQSNVYYLHDFAGGRYGYSIRPHTRKTFATIATIGYSGDHLVKQNYVACLQPPDPDVLLVYLHGDEVSYRQLLDPGWEQENAAWGVSAPRRWTVLQSCPQRDEAIAATVDGSTIQARVRTEETWGTARSFSDEGSDAYRPFDLAYESQSGSALFVGRVDASSQLYYLVWDGLAWSAPSPVAGPAFTSGSIHFVQATSSPTSDEILVLVGTDDESLIFYRWDGSALTLLAEMPGELSRSDQPAFTTAYEQVSGHAVIIWSSQSGAAPRYRTWNGTALGSPRALGSTSDSATLFRTATNPAGDDLAICALDRSRGLSLFYWNGSAWAGSRQLTSTATHEDRYCFDLAYSDGGSLAVWAEGSSNTIRSLRWDWGQPIAQATLRDGVTFEAAPSLVRLCARPQNSNVIIIVALADNSVHATYWKKDRYVLNPPQELTGDLLVTRGTPLDLVTQRHAN